MYCINLYTDNTAAISVATTERGSERNKQIELKAHHISEYMQKKVVNLEHVPTEHLPADLLTKANNPRSIDHLSSLIGMRPFPIVHRRDGDGMGGKT